MWGGPHGHLEYTPEVEQFDKFSDPEAWLKQQPRADTPQVIDLRDGASSVAEMSPGRITPTGEFILKAPEAKASDADTGDGKLPITLENTLGAATHGKLVQQGKASKLSAQALANPGVREYTLSLPGQADQLPTEQEVVAMLRRTLEAPADYNLRSMQTFTPEYLQALQQAGQLRYEPEAGQWQWNVRVPEEVIARIANVKAGKPAEATDDLSWRQLGNLFAGSLAQESPDLVAGLEGGGAALAKTASNVGKLATLQNPQTAPETALDQFAQKLSADAQTVRQLDPSVLGQLQRGLLTGVVTMPMVMELAVAGGMPAVLSHGVLSRAHLSQEEQLKGLITEIGTFQALHAASTLPGVVQTGIGGGMYALGGVATGQVNTGEDALAEFLQGMAMSPAAKRSPVEDVRLSPLGRELKRDPYASPAEAAAEEAAQLAYLEARQANTARPPNRQARLPFDEAPASSDAPLPPNAQPAKPSDAPLERPAAANVRPPETPPKFTDPTEWLGQPSAAGQKPGAEPMPVAEPFTEGGYFARRRAERTAARTAAAQEVDTLFADFLPPEAAAQPITGDKQAVPPASLPSVTEQAAPSPAAQPTLKQKIGAALEKAGIAEPIGKSPPSDLELQFGVNPIAAAKSIGKALQANINDTSIPPGYDLQGYARELRQQVTASIQAGRLDPTWTQSLLASVQKQLGGNPSSPHTRFTTAVQKHLTAAFDAFNRGDGPALAHAQRELASLVQSPRHKFLADIARPLMLGTELSMVGIQGGYHLITHPVITARAAVLGLKSAKTNAPSSWFTKFQNNPRQAVTELLLSDSSRGYDEITQAIRNHRSTKTAEKAGLELDTQMELDASVPFHERTEGYASSAIRKLPLWRQTERFGKVFMDAQRLMLFEKGAQILAGKGKTYDKNPEAFQELARSINITSGRGQFGSYQQVARFLTNFGTSPRLILSQFQLLNPKEFVRAYKADPSIAKAKLADVAKVTSFTLGLMGLASNAGWDVRLDPDDPQFGMAKRPNSDYAISILPDALRPQLKLIGRIIKNIADVQELGLSGVLAETGKDTLRYLRGKSAPLFSAVIDQAIPYQKNKFSPPLAPQDEVTNRPENLLKASLQTLPPAMYQWLDRHPRWGYGTDFLNRPVTALDSVTQRLTPIYWNTVYDALRKEGLTAGEKAARLVPEFFGKATSDFAPTWQRLEAWSGDLNAELHKHKLNPSVSQLEGEPRTQYQERVARAQQMLNQYGEKLLGDNLYRQAKPEQQAALLRLLEERITDVADGQANKKHPNVGKLSASALHRAVLQSEQRKQAEATRRRQQNLSVPQR